MTKQEAIQNQSCPEFPYFGARYPDATCIDGYLWDLDSNEGDMLTKGGETPCPFCNAESFIEHYLDEGSKYTREHVLRHVEALRKRYSRPSPPIY